MKKSGIKNLTSILGFAFALLIGISGSLHAQNETKTTSLTSKVQRIIDAKKLILLRWKLSFPISRRCWLIFMEIIFAFFRIIPKRIEHPQATEAKISARQSPETAC